ncbi:sensor histidine kinase [Paenibacillus rhizoplanae]
MTIIVLTILVSFRITAPIKQLTRYMNQVQTGNLNIEIRPAGNDEIGVVTEHFRSMMDTINNLILREYRLELASRTNELRALQSQINPHFLNNTLQIIGTLALELKVPQIYGLLSALAKMMRYSMYNDEKVVTVQNEMDHVKAYIQLQKERFENKFSFRCEVEEPLLQALMPKMILQPIVENYFKHGFQLDRQDGYMEINVTGLTPERMEISIANNGLPIPAGRAGGAAQGAGAVQHR